MKLIKSGDDVIVLAGKDIQEKEASIHISNVALFNPKTKKGGRVGVRVNSAGKKERFFNADDSAVD